MVDEIAMVGEINTRRERCESDRRLFLGTGGGDNDDGDGTDSPGGSKPRAIPTHLGHFVGSAPEDTTITTSPPSVRGFTTGSSHNDQDLVSGMIKAASSRLRRECVDEKLIETIEESGSVGYLRHSQIEVGDKLGDGSFSSVFEIRSLRMDGSDGEPGCPLVLEKRDTGKPPMPDQLVIKILKPKLVRKPSVLSTCTADLIKEGAILASLGSHPNVLPLVAWTPTGLGGFGDSSCGIRHDSFFLVLGRLEDSLNDRLDEWRSEKSQLLAVRKVPHNTWQWQKYECFQERFRILTDLASAIQHVHSRGILHRDLKPNNIGFDARDTLKLFDFDVARILPEGSKTSSHASTKPENQTFRLTQHVGTQRYMSPECAKGEPYNAKADVYAFGLVCHEILTLQLPYSDILRPDQHYRSVVVGGKRPSLPRKWPKPLRQFLSNCWSNSIASRPTMEKAFDFLSKESQTIATGLEKKTKGDLILSALNSFREEAPKGVLRDSEKDGEGNARVTAFDSFREKAQSMVADWDSRSKLKPTKGLLRRKVSSIRGPSHWIPTLKPKDAPLGNATKEDSDCCSSVGRRQ